MARFRLKRGIFYFVRSFLYSVFSRCGRLVAKLLPFCLVFCIIISIFTISSSAATNLIESNLTSSSWSWFSDSYTFTTNPSLYYNTSTTASRITIPSNPDGAYAMRYTSIPSNSVFPNDTYTLSFDVYGDFSKCRLGIAVKLNGNSTGNGGYLVTIYENFNTGNNIYTHGQVNFVPSNMASNVDRIQLELWFLPADTSSQVQLYIKNLTLTDATDDSGMWSRLWTWLQNLYNKLGDMLNSLVGIASNVGQGFSNVLTDVKAFIVGGTDHNGVVHQGIAANIGNFITNLGSTIGGFFQDLWEDLSDAFDDIGQWFIDLKDNIIDGLHDLFVPDDDYFSDKLDDLNTWLTAHFGVLYQGPFLLVDFLQKLFTFTPRDNFVIGIPDIEFNFGGQHYNLDFGSTYSFAWVNDSSHPLYYFYSFYRGFVTVILFFAFFTFLKNKYLQIFNNGVGSDDS